MDQTCKWRIIHIQNNKKHPKSSKMNYTKYIQINVTKVIETDNKINYLYIKKL